MAIQFDSPIKQLFVGRQPELEILQREFTGPVAKFVCITGPGGMGKTSLAMMFAETNRDSFPGGVYNLHATSLEGVDVAVDKYVKGGINPYLIIVDDLESRPIDKVEHELFLIRQRHPNGRFLATTRFSHPSTVFDLQLRLSGLSQAEFNDLLQKRLHYLSSPQSANEMYEAFMGHPLATRLAVDLLKKGDITPRELLERLQSFTWAGLVDSLGAEIPDETPEHRQIIADVTSVSDDFLFRLHENPELLYELTPRGFEELVAELLGRLDYEITLTPVSKDGGKDIYAAKKDHLGTFLYVVECKKYAPDNRVGVGLVRQLNGVVQAEQATAGILATTSFFTSGAKEFQKAISYQISLKDYLGIQDWLKAVLNK